MYYHCQGCQNGSRHNSLCYKSGVFETFLVRKKEDIDSINVYGKKENVNKALSFKT